MFTYLQPQAEVTSSLSTADLVTSCDLNQFKSRLCCMFVKIQFDLYVINILKLGVGVGVGGRCRFLPVTYRTGFTGRTTNYE